MTPNLEDLVLAADARGRRLAAAALLPPTRTPPVPYAPLAGTRQPGLGPRRARPGGAASRYRGVFWTASGRWGAQIRVRGRRHYGGLHDSERAAARAHDRLAIELVGAAAVLNFPEVGGPR